MVVRRTENHPADAALRDKSVFALRRLGRRALGLVKRLEMVFQHMLDRFVFGQPQRVIERAGEQRLSDLAVRFLLHAERDRVALGFLQNQPGDVEQRIGAAGGLDLAGEGFHPFFVGDEGNTDFRQRQRRFAVFARFAPAKRGPLLKGPSAIIGAAGLSALVAAGAALPRALAGSAFPAGRPAIAAFASAFGPVLAAFILRVMFGRGGLLRPGGQKELVQIQFVFRQCAHSFMSAPRSSGLG